MANWGPVGAPHAPPRGGRASVMQNPVLSTTLTCPVHTKGLHHHTPAWFTWLLEFHPHHHRCIASHSLPSACLSRRHVNSTPQSAWSCCRCVVLLRMPTSTANLTSLNAPVVHQPPPLYPPNTAEYTHCYLVRTSRTVMHGLGGVNLGSSGCASAVHLPLASAWHYTCTGSSLLLRQAAPWHQTPLGRLQPMK